MKFKYNVIGDNTQENREWLEKVGYKSLRFFQGKKYLYATTCQRANAKEVWNEPYYGTVDDVDFYVSCGFIPILGNTPLFKAVSAMREDKIGSDQYYVLDKDKGHIKDGEFVIDYPKGSIVKNPLSLFTSFEGHKATLEELQEHFKK